MLSVKTTNSAKGWNARFAQIVEHGKELAKGSIALMGLVLTSAVFGLIGRAAASPRGSSVKHSGSGAEIVELNKDGSPVEPLVETDPDFSSSVSSGSSTEELLDFGGLEETSNEAIKTSHSTATPIPAVHPIADQIVRVGEPFSLTLNPIQIFSDKDNADIWFTKFSQRDGSSLPGGLSVNTVDINPVLVSTYNSTPDSFLSVVLRNDIAYATAWYSSTATLQAIDISNPVQPTLVGLSKNVPRGYAFRPVINDDYILIPSRESHQVFIVSLSDLALVGTCQTSSTVNGIAVKNRIIYVAESSSIEMFNYTDPTNPQFVGQYQTTAFEVAINKDIDVLYVAGDQGVISLDVGEPSYPVLMGFYNTTDTVGTIFLNNRLAYVGSKNNGLVVLDTSDPFQLQSRGVSKSSSSGNRISAKSDFVFVSNGYSGITITHIENPKNSSLPQNPVLLSTHRTTQACTTQVRGPYAYVADGTGGMRIIQGNWLKKSLSGTPTNANQIGNYTIQVDAEIPDSDITFSTSFNFKIQKSLSIVAPSSVVPYIEDQSIINITPPIALNTPSPIVDTSLTVNNTDAVQIATGTAGSVVSTYNTSTGVWLAKGTRLNVNILFSQLQILLKPLFHHPFSISGNVIDGYGQSENFTISFAGTHINHPPYVKIPLTAQTGCCQAIVEQPYSFSANRETIKDPDNDILTYTALYPSWASFNNETLTFSGTPNQVGVFDLMLIGTDPSGASANSTFTTDVRLPPPTLWTNQITLHRCDTLNLNSTHFNATCPGQEAGSLQFNFYDIQNGGFYFVDAPTIPTTSFNQSQLWNQQVQFKHPCTLTAPTFVTKVFSSEYPDITPQPASVIFYPDQPVVVNKQLTVDECGVTNITSSMLSGYNPVARSIVLYPTFFPLNLQNGHFALANAITTPLSSFSEDLTTNKQLVFVHSCNRLPPNGDLIFGDGCANSTRVPITFNFNYMPHVVMEQPLHINEKRGTILTSKHLNVVATGSDLNQVVFFPSDLRFVHFSDINGTSLDYFGQWQVANQTVQCIHTGGATDLPGFNIAASNGRLTEPPVAVNVTFNEAPVWGRKELGITQGQTVTVSLANNFLATHYGVVDNSLLFLICGNSHIDFGNVATAQMRVSNFTQMDVVNYFIQATHDGTPNAPAVNISIYDGLMTTDPTPVEITFRYAVAFSLLNNQFTIHENTTKILTTQNLDVSNPANYQATAIEYTVSNIQHCRFENSDNPGAFSDPFKFTKQNLLDGKISIIHDGSKSSPSWDVAVKAGNEQIAATPTFIRFTNSPPILIKSELTVVEGKTSNITAGNFNATDVDTAPNKLIFAITNLVHGSFVYANTTAPAIYSFSLQKVLDKQIQFIHDGSEIKPTFSIAVSNDETKVSTEPKEATVAFTNLPPTIVNNKIIIQEGGRLTLGQANLYATDTGTTAAGITYNVTNLQHGRFEKIDPQTGEVVTNFTQDDITFTQDDIAFGRIVFTHDRSKYPPSYTIVATDGHVISDKSTVAVEGYKNLPPTLTAKSIRVNQGQTIFLNASNFNTTDVDPNFNGTITFNVTDVRYGHFAYAATPTSPISIFSLQDVRDGRVVVFVHDGSQNKPSFNVTAYDGYETDPVIAQVGEVQFNHKPVVSNPIASQPQCCGSSIGYPYSFAFADNTFIDPDSTDTLTYTATQADGSPLPNGMNFDSNTRTFTWTPDNASLIGSLNFKVTATDSGNPPLSVSDSFALNITKSLITTINSDPITYTEEQDRVLSDLIAINNSPPNAVITASVTIDPALGQLLTSSISGVTSSYNSTTGEWKVIGSTAAVNAHLSLLTFRPKALSYAPVTFFVKVTDQYDQTETGNILANGIHVNHSPYVNPDNNLAKQVPLCCEASVGKPYSFTFDANTFKDPDNDNLTYSAAKADGTALPTGMIFDSSTRTFTWTPNNATYIGNLNLKVTAFDPSGASVSDTFSLAIAKTISATNSTAPLAYTEEVEQKLSSIVINTPSGTATARLVLSNKLAGSLTTGTSGNVTSTYDAQTGTWSASGNKVDVNSLLENLTFKPAALFYAPFNIAVSINDGYEQSLESSISATGTHVNHPPVVNKHLQEQTLCCSAAVGNSYAFTFDPESFTDPDKDTLTYNATLANGTALPTWLQFNPTTRTFFGTPNNATQIGDLNLKVIASDPSGASVSDIFTLTIAKTLSLEMQSSSTTYTEEQDKTLSGLITINNSPPIAVITASVTIDPSLGQLLTSSISGVTSSYNSTTGEWKVIGSTAAVNAHLSLLTFRPKALSYAPVTFSVKVTDQYNQTETGNILANGIHVNHTPVVNTSISLQPQCCAAGIGNLYTFVCASDTFKDPDGDALTYAATLASDNPLPNWLNFNPTTLTFSGTPNDASEIGNLNLKVTATDPSNASVSSEFTLAIARTLSATNIAKPLAYTEEVNFRLSTIVLTTPSNKASIQLKLSNPLAGRLEPTSTHGEATYTYDNANGTLTISGSKDGVNALLDGVTFKPAPLFYAPFTIAVNVNDGYNQTLSSSIFATGTHVNHPPVVNKAINSQPQCCAAGIGNPYTFACASDTFKDPDGDALTYAATLANGNPLPNWLNFNPTTLTFSGTPNDASEIGNLNLKVTATDPSNASVSSEFTLAIARTLSATNIAKPLAYTEEVNFRLSTIVLTTPSNKASIQLKLSNPLAGRLEPTSTHGEATYTYDNANGTLSISGSKDGVNALLDGVTFKPAPLFYAPFTIAVNVNDGYNQTLSSSILATGTHVNHPPVVNKAINSQPQCCAAGVGNLYTFVCASDTFKDPDGDALTYAATLANGNPLPNWLNFNPTTLTFSGTPNDASQIGNLSLKITATDNGTPPLSASDTFTIGISKTLAVTNATQAINYTEGAPLKLSPILVNSPSTTATVQLKLSIPAAGSLNTATSGNVTSEYNNTTGIWAASGNKGDVNALLANLTFTPKPLSYIPFDITADITDGYEQTSTSTMHATGTHINHNPVVSNPIASQPQCCDASVGNPYSFAFAANTFTDPDSTDTLTYTATQADGSPLPNGMTFDTKTRTFTWTPDNASLIGSLNLKVTATDSGNPPLSVSDSFTLNIAKTLSISRVTSDFVYTEDHEQIISPIEITTPSPTITAKVTLREHADGELLTETISGITSTYNKNTGEWQAAGNTAAINALLSRLKFKPRNYFYGSVHLDAEVADIFKQTENGTITGTGIHVNHPPIIIGSRKDQPECITANIGEEHNCTTIPGSVYDPDGDPITTITTLENGSALPLGLYYAPNRMAVLGAINNASYTGTWKFVFKATDSYNLSTTDVYTVQSSQTLFAVGLNTPFTYTQDDTTRIPAFEVVTPSNSVVACFNTNDTKAGNILSKAMIVSSAQFFTGEGGSCFNDTVPQANTLLARLDYTPPTSYRDNFILAVKFTDEFGQTVFGNRTATGLPAETKINATPYIIISTVAGSLVLAGAGALTIVWCRNKNKPHRKFLSEDILEGVRLNPIAFGKNIIIKPESIEKIKLLGKGGAGEVYLAKWNGSLVALKILTICSQANQENIQNSFETEAAVMINLRHENIIRFLGLCQNPPSLVMEYMQLGSLDKVLASDIPLAWALRLKIAYDILKGLAYLHSLPNPIIHRDLKSPNILLDRNFKAKITDFGISTARALIQATTYTNGGGGTMAWMAPEQINNPNPNIDTSSKKSDIYSFGMICWEIATRQLPGCTPYIIIQQATSGTRPKIPEGTPPKFSEIITRCWAQVPNARPEAQALVKEFEQLVPEEPDVNTTPQSLPLSEARHSTLMPPPKASAKPNMQGPKNLHTKPTLNLALPQSSSPNPLYTYSGPANKQKPNVRQAPGFATPNPMYVPHASITPAGRAL